MTSIGPEVDDERYLAEAAREMVSAFKSQRFQHVVALFDQLIQSRVGVSPDELLDRLAAAGGKSLRSVLIRSYAYSPCWFCEMGMAHCETCDGAGLVDEELFCADCHGLGKTRCTVCFGSSFVILDEVPEHFRDTVVAERLNLAERAYSDLKKRMEALETPSHPAGALLRRLHHQNQQVMGVLHNCRAQMTKRAMEAQVGKFNSMVRGVQDTYHRLTAECAQASLGSALRLLEGDHPTGNSEQGHKLTRSIAHHAAVARGYADILRRAGMREASESIDLEIQDLERSLRAGQVQQMVVPVGKPAETAVAPAEPTTPRKTEADTQAVVGFVEDLSEEQIQEVAAMFEEEFYTQGRPADWVRQAIGNSTVNIAITRREGKTTTVVGFVRALSDGVLKAVVHDLVIAKTSRGAGMGRLLMSRLMSHPQMKNVRDVEVACLPEAVGMFKQWGFSESVDDRVLLRYVRLRR